MSLTLTAAQPGVHAFHIHAVGKCEPPDFKSAGPHFNPDQTRHGIMSPEGPHAGDLPNIHVPADGKLEVEFLNPVVTLSQESALLDEDGSAIVIHAGADDYKTDPAGNAGDRIACGVIAKFVPLRALTEREMGGGQGVGMRLTTSPTLPLQREANGLDCPRP